MPGWYLYRSNGDGTLPGDGWMFVEVSNGPPFFVQFAGLDVMSLLEDAVADGQFGARVEIVVDTAKSVGDSGYLRLNLWPTKLE